MYTNFGTIWGLTQPAGTAAEPGAQPTEGTATQGAPDSSPPSPMGACGGGDPVMSIVLMLGMVAVFYFLLIRPQQKKAKEHQNMLGGLKKGDEVVTGGGIVGKITGITDKLITLEVSEKVRVRVMKAQIVDKFSG